MRVPDLEAEIDNWENAYTCEVMEMRMTAKDMLFRKDHRRMMDAIAAVYQVSDQYLGKIVDQNGEPPAWTPTLGKPNNKPKSI